MNLLKIIVTIVSSLTLIAAITHTNTEIGHTKRSLPSTPPMSPNVGVLERRTRDGKKPNTVQCDLANPGEPKNILTFDLDDCKKAATCLAEKRSYPNTDMMLAGYCLVMTIDSTTPDGRPYVTQTWTPRVMKALVSSIWDGRNCKIKYTKPLRYRVWPEISEKELVVGMITLALNGEPTKNRPCVVPTGSVREGILMLTSEMRASHTPGVSG